MEVLDPAAMVGVHQLPLLTQLLKLVIARRAVADLKDVVRDSHLDGLLGQLLDL